MLMIFTQSNERIANPRNRGSVLLLVVGLLTIMAMLGTSFLLIARLNRKTTQALNSMDLSVFANSIANGLASTLKNDLHISPTGRPYSQNSNGLSFIDAPSFSSGGDSFLASPYPFKDKNDSNTWKWHHISKLDSTEPTSQYEDVVLDDPELVDTDGDGWKDARLRWSGLYSTSGNKIYSAVRMIDLSGLINVNVATAPTQYPDFANTGYWPPYMAPVAIDLYSLLGDSIYTRLNNYRRNGTGGTPKDVHYDMALQQYSPRNGKQPFSIGNEWYCRWLGESALIRVGELFNATSNNGVPLGVHQVRYLTTTSVSRSYLRRPSSSFTRRLQFWTMDASGTEQNNSKSDNHPLTSESARNDLVDMFAEMIGGSDGNKKAAHYVANLWAYIDGQDQSKSYEVTKDSLTVYGVVPQAVISEVFARGQRDMSGNLTEVQAVEIFNPTNRILTNYEIRCGSKTIPLGSMSPWSYTVIVSKQGDPDEDFFPNPSGSPIDEDGIDFNGGKKVELWRTAPDSGGTEIKMDSSSLSYTTPATDGQSSGPVGKKRDTHAKRARFLIPQYKTINDTNHSLGGDNGIGPDALTASNPPEVYEGFTIPEKNPDVGIRSVGAILDLFFVGPEGGATHSSLPENLVAYMADESRAKPPAFAGGESANSPYFPAVPWGALLAEFFECVPTDPTRELESENIYHYGKININSAPPRVLMSLPWPSFIDYDHDGIKDGPDEPTVSVDPQNIADFLCEYRRNDGPFLSEGDINQALSEYARTIFPDKTKYNYLPAMNCFFESIANLITVRSDVFFVSLSLQDARHQKNANQKDVFMGYIDRSRCYNNTNNPIVVLRPVW